MKMVWLNRGVCLVVLLLGWQVVAAQAGPAVLTSIKPLQLIAVAVHGDPEAVESLLDPGRPHHEYQLRPSERGRLVQADVIFWIGPGLEAFLERPLATLPDSVRVEALLSPEDLASGRTGHDHPDAHVWLDPERAIAIARRMADVLSELDPSGRERWHRNADRFAATLRDADGEVRRLLDGKGLQPYLVMHDAYGHFEVSHGLHRAATLTITPEQQPGARHLLEIRRLFENGRIRCVFREPQYESKSLQRMIEDYRPRVAMLDPMAMLAPVSQDGFVEFYRGFGRAVAACLNEEG